MSFPRLRNQVIKLDSIARPIERKDITPSNNQVSLASSVHEGANKIYVHSNNGRDAHERKGICVSQSGKCQVPHELRTRIWLLLLNNGSTRRLGRKGVKKVLPVIGC